MSPRTTARPSSTSPDSKRFPGVHTLSSVAECCHRRAATLGFGYLPKVQVLIPPFRQTPRSDSSFGSSCAYARNSRSDRLLGIAGLVLPRCICSFQIEEVILTLHKHRAVIPLWFKHRGSSVRHLRCCQEKRRVEVLTKSFDAQLQEVGIDRVRALSANVACIIQVVEKL